MNWKSALFLWFIARKRGSTFLNGENDTVSLFLEWPAMTFFFFFMSLFGAAYFQHKSRPGQVHYTCTYHMQMYTHDCEEPTGTQTNENERLVVDV